MRNSPPGPSSEGPAPHGRGDDAVGDYIRLHARRALDGIARVGTDMPEETVHDARTSLRRLRATVRTFRGAVCDAAAADATLQALALPLGSVRDVDVLAALLLTSPDAAGAATEQEEARELLGKELRSRRRGALAALEAAADTGPWREGASLLERWCSTPPSPPVPDAAELLDRAEAEARRRLHLADGEPAALHRARRAAKRWRFAAELLAGVPGAEASRARAQRMQDLLGEVQDLEVADALLAEVLAGPGAAGTTRSALEQLRARLRRRQQEFISRAGEVT